MQANVPFFRPSIGEQELEAAVAVLRSGWLTCGPKCREFEEKFSQMIGENVHSVAVNSATAGLHLAGEACGLGPGDEVLVPTLTFSASAAVFRHLGADVVLVDVDHSLTIDLEDAARKLSPRSRAIVPVHFGGWPCDMAKILAFARKNGLKVIEDAAHALPAHRDGRLIGAWSSEACVFSFYANKTITTGEGGMVTTRDPEIANRIKIMRSHGLNHAAFDRFRRVGAAWSYDVVAPGFNYSLPDFAAAIGVAQLGKAYMLQSQRQRAAALYVKLLADLPIDFPPPAPPDALHAWHLFPIRVRANAGVSRDELIALLTQNGIGSSVHYRPLHQMTYWRGERRYRRGDFPIADRYFESAVTLPLFPDIRRGEIERVARVLRGAFERCLSC